MAQKEQMDYKMDDEEFEKLMKLLARLGGGSGGTYSGYQPVGTRDYNFSDNKMGKFGMGYDGSLGGSKFGPIMNLGPTGKYNRNTIDKMQIADMLNKKPGKEGRMQYDLESLINPTGQDYGQKNRYASLAPSNGQGSSINMYVFNFGSEKESSTVKDQYNHSGQNSFIPVYNQKTGSLEYLITQVGQQYDEKSGEGMPQYMVISVGYNGKADGVNYSGVANGYSQGKMGYTGARIGQLTGAKAGYDAGTGSSTGAQASGGSGSAGSNSVGGGGSK